MGFRLRKSENASAGARRIAREEIGGALDLLAEEDGDPAERIHEARKHFKKIRAVLRLVRGEVGEEVYVRDNAAVRDLGRRLSSARDAAVRVAALDHLREGLHRDFPAEEMAAVRKKLVSRHRAAVGRVLRGPALGAMARELKNLRRRVHAWPMTNTGWACLEAGLRRTYRQGRKARSQACRLGTDQAFHEWRKRAKDLRYHIDLLSPAWPAVLEEVEKVLHELTDCLGDDHDFAVLRQVLASSPGLRPLSGAGSALAERIELRRPELQARARSLGARIYSEKPKRFTDRMASYWNAWRS